MCKLITSYRLPSTPVSTVSATKENDYKYVINNTFATKYLMLHTISCLPKQNAEVQSHTQKKKKKENVQKHKHKTWKKNTSSIVFSAVIYRQFINSGTSLKAVFSIKEFNRLKTILRAVLLLHFCNCKGICKQTSIIPSKKKKKNPFKPD